jgi:hypothetical protein
MPLQPLHALQCMCTAAACVSIGSPACLVTGLPVAPSGIPNPSGRTASKQQVQTATAQLRSCAVRLREPCRSTACCSRMRCVKQRLQPCSAHTTACSLRLTCSCTQPFTADDWHRLRSWRRHLPNFTFIFVLRGCVAAARRTCSELAVSAAVPALTACDTPRRYLFWVVYFTILSFLWAAYQQWLVVRPGAPCSAQLRCLSRRRGRGEGSGRARSRWARRAGRRRTAGAWCGRRCR